MFETSRSSLCTKRFLHDRDSKLFHSKDHTHVLARHLEGDAGLIVDVEKEDGGLAAPQPADLGDDHGATLDLCASDDVTDRSVQGHPIPLDRRLHPPIGVCSGKSSNDSSFIE